MPLAQHPPTSVDVTHRTSAALLRDDLCEFLADYTLCPPPSVDEISDEEAEAMVSDDQARRLGDRLKNMLHGMDIAKRRDAMKAGA